METKLYHPDAFSNRRLSSARLFEGVMLGLRFNRIQSLAQKLNLAAGVARSPTAGHGVPAGIRIIGSNQWIAGR